MSVDLIRYDLLVQDALRGVVRRVLADVARDGLPGDHHLYISFDTGSPGVKLSPRLKGMYPEKMTIVLQHQFWDLIVTDQAFEVGLWFKGVPERLHVAFDAVEDFVDPSVKFRLLFQPGTGDSDEDDDDETPAVPGPRAVPDRPRAAPRGAGSEPAETPPPVERPRAGPTSVPATPAKAVPAKPTPVKPAPVKPAAAKVEPERTATAAKPVVKEPTKPAPAPAAPAGDAPDGEAPAAGGAQVVRLDTFRKK
ncbi:ClpXP protease specificity-enhancing factor SspB [Ancylobacter terrae]|uniref:ClpXP protease specificity-enhancing factor SspB n=1 Tax=Ancylobacter sp. sgz301288 TaxID=3342077 RepID=UPI00385B91A2